MTTAQWRVSVDGRLCRGTGLCVGTAADHFELGSDLRSHLRTELVDPDPAVMDAATCCPTEAITVTEVGTDRAIYPEEPVAAVEGRPAQVDAGPRALEGRDRPRLMLFVGARSVRIADTCNPLARLADVVIATSEDILAERADSIDESVRHSHAIVVPTKDMILAEAVRFGRQHRVDGALSLSEDVIDLAARFAAELGLPGQPPETIPQLRDKYAQRMALAAAGVPVPAHFAIRRPEEVPAALEAVPLPAIVKPMRGSGGALTYVVSTADQLEPVLREAFAYVRTAGGAVEEDAGFILESLLVGARWHDVPGLAPYVSVESAAMGGRIVHWAVTDRFPLSPPTLETGLMLPSCLRPDQQEQIIDLAGRALDALGYRHGLAHTEIMLTADGPRVIEVNARSGGALPYLFALASDLDLVQEAGRVALGQPPATAVRFDGRALFVGPQHPVGVQVTSVSGLDEVRTLPGVRHVIPLSVSGASTDRFQHTLIAAVLAVTPTAEEAVQLWRAVMDTVQPEYRSDEVADRHRRAPGSTASMEGDAGVVHAVPPVLASRRLPVS